MEALKSTVEHRGTAHIFKDVRKRMEEIKESETLKSRWIKYAKDYRYAEGITYEDVMDALIKLL